MCKHKFITCIIYVQNYCFTRYTLSLYCVSHNVVWCCLHIQYKGKKCNTSCGTPLSLAVKLLTCLSIQTGAAHACGSPLYILSIYKSSFHSICKVTQSRLSQSTEQNSTSLLRMYTLAYVRIYSIRLVHERSDISHITF